MDSETAPSDQVAGDPPSSTGGGGRRRRAEAVAAATAARARARVPRFSDLGPMPIDDPLAMNAWAHRALGVALAQAVRDPSLDDSARRRELCDLAARMAALTPQSRLQTAEQAVLQDHAALADGGGPVMEPVHASAVGPERTASGGGKARRGRPPKRAVR